LRLLASERARLVKRLAELTQLSSSSTPSSDVVSSEIAQLNKDMASIDREQASFAIDQKRSPDACWTLFSILHRLV
jgi:hypothetical protein